MKTILIFLTTMFSSYLDAPKQPIQNNVTLTYTYYSKNCSYDVYKAPAGGTVTCRDWESVGTVYNGNSVSVTLRPGDNYLIRVVHGNAGVCQGNKQKRQDNVSMKSNAKKSLNYSFELYDREC
ncbi:MAG: hypothetical protein AAF600_07190 [Bacteroidota bacterium]